MKYRTLFYAIPLIMAQYSAIAYGADPCSGVQGGGNGLKGTTFGLTPSWSAGSEYCKATDGDINTFYDAAQADSAYTGLDFGSGVQIGKIRFSPRPGYESRMVGGKFQVSFSSDSTGYADLYTITTTPAAGWNEVSVSNPFPNQRPLRWVRYLAPTGGYGNIAEMEFYAGSTPFNGPHYITNGAVMELEDFDNGGEGIAYHDNDPANNGGAYRTAEGVDIESNGAGGYDVGWTNAGEWMKYSFTGVNSGTYDITLYASSPNYGTKQVKLYEEATLKATFTIPYTGGWQTYQAITVKGVSIDGGSAPVFMVESTTGGYNLDKLTFATTVQDPCAGVQGGGGGLSGTTFGLTPSLSAGSEYCKATDGDINTFYDAAQADSAYTGLDFGRGAIIGKIKFYPRAGSASRMVGGKFQVSIYGDNYGWTDLYTITATPVAGWNEAVVFNPFPYDMSSRWVRYLAPAGGYGNIAEMEFYEASAFPDLNKWYKITTKANTDLGLDVSGGSYANNTAIELLTKANINQEFSFKDAGSGYYTITCRADAGYSIDMSGNFENGQTLKLWTTDVTNANQKFKLVSLSGGIYRLESSNSGYSIDNWGAGGDGVKPALWTSSDNNNNQKWVITEVQ
jgi:Carbohydrate binding module (family 6)/Ricin-type beta-trefoil lectin domain-like